MRGTTSDLYVVDDIAKEDPNIRLYWFTRVIFGVSSSPFLLNATVKYHLEKFMDTNEAVVKQLLNSPPTYT